MSIRGSNEILAMVVHEFPQKRNKITELFTESTSFIEICEDYVLCMKSIKSAEKEKNKIKDNGIAELKSLLIELKYELLSKIET